MTPHKFSPQRGEHPALTDDLTYSVFVRSEIASPSIKGCDWDEILVAVPPEDAFEKVNMTVNLWDDRYPVYCPMPSDDDEVNAVTRFSSVPNATMFDPAWEDPKYETLLWHRVVPVDRWEHPEKPPTHLPRSACAHGVDYRFDAEVVLVLAWDDARIVAAVV